MVTAGFSLQDNLGKVRSYKETFLLQHGGGPGNAFLTFSDADIRFAEKKFVCRAFTHNQEA